MSELPFLLLVFWAAVNPAASVSALAPAGSDRADRAWALPAMGAVLAGAGLAGALLLLAVAAREPFLDFLDVSAASFEVAAGLIMIAGSLRPLWQGRALEATTSLGSGDLRHALAPLAVPLMASPAALAAAISYGDRTDALATAVAAALLVALTAAAIGWRSSLTRAVGGATVAAVARLSGALLVVLGFGLVVDGVLSI